MQHQWCLVGHNRLPRGRQFSWCLKLLIWSYTSSGEYCWRSIEGRTLEWKWTKWWNNWKLCDKRNKARKSWQELEWLYLWCQTLRYLFSGCKQTLSTKRTLPKHIVIIIKFFLNYSNMHHLLWWIYHEFKSLKFKCI